MPGGGGGRGRDLDGTAAASAVVMQVTRLVVFGAASNLTARTLGIGLVRAPAAAAGAWVGKRILDRLEVAVFTVLAEIGLVAAGVLLIVQS